MVRLILYCLVSVLCLSSCNDHLKIEKNNDPQGVADSQVVGTWKITAVVSDVPWDWNGDGSTEKNIYATWGACQKDNLYTFVGDKTGTFQINCSSTYPGSWEIRANTYTPEYLVYTPLGQSPEAERISGMTSVQFQTALALQLSNGQAA